MRLHEIFSCIWNVQLKREGNVEVEEKEVGHAQLWWRFVVSECSCITALNYFQLIFCCDCFTFRQFIIIMHYYYIFHLCTVIPSKRRLKSVYWNHQMVSLYQKVSDVKLCLKFLTDFIKTWYTWSTCCAVQLTVFRSMWSCTCLLLVFHHLLW